MQQAAVRQKGAMKIRSVIVGLAAAAACVLLGFRAPSAFADDTAWRPFASKETTAEKAARILAAYPDHLERLEGDALVWKDGTRMVFDDGNNSRSFDALLRTPDIKDQFAIPYPLEFSRQAPPKYFDPGRFRNEKFFTKMYGDCSSGEVTRKLAAVAWLPERGGGTLHVTTINRVNEKLGAVSRELEALPDRFAQFLVPAAGGYACRSIEGTKIRSAHSYGAAIDINARLGDYWRWQSKARLGYRNKIPEEIVQIFEKHGFIWGGKWYHFDTMHFEYRPELIGMKP